MKKRALFILQLLLIMGFFSSLFGFRSSSEEEVTSVETDEIRYETVLDSVKIAYRETGKGENYLLMIHGLGSNLDVWQKIVPELESQFRLIRVDLPGYGHSGGDYAYSLAFFAECMEAFVAKKGIKSLHLMGHSMGGQIALHLALRNKAPVERLILLAPAGFETFSAAESGILQAATTPEALLALSPEKIQKNFALNFVGNQLPEDAQFMYDYRMEMREDTALYQAYCRMIPACVKAMLDEPVYQRLPEIEQATLVIYGAEDLLIPNRYFHPTLSVQKVAESGHNQLPNSQLHIIPQCGHMVPWDQPSQVADHIKTFVTP